MENYEQKYNKLVNAIKVLQETNPSDVGIQNWVNDNVPELRESEDERIREEIANLIMQSTCNTKEFYRKRELIEWLEKQGQKPAWGKEDRDYYDAIIAKLEVTQDDAALTDNQMEFLKSLKDRVHLKQEWSEEDYAMIEAATNLAHEYGRHGLWVWLKSLKQRHTWKPSDEQIEVLESLIENRSIQRRHLVSLYEQLKKLKGE